MAKIENKVQYEWALKRVEELLPLVDDNTPLDDSNSIELELLSNMVADYSEEHFAMGTPSLAECPYQETMILFFPPLKQ